MYAALCGKLKDSSELVHVICKGEEPPKGIVLYFKLSSFVIIFRNVNALDKPFVQLLKKALTLVLQLKEKVVVKVLRKLSSALGIVIAYHVAKQFFVLETLETLTGFSHK